MKKHFLLILICCGIWQQSFSTQHVWKGTTSNAWNLAGNWSPSGIPGSSDTAVFDNTCTSCNCTLGGTVNVKMINMKSTYTGTITQGTIAVTIGTSGFTIAGGTFTGGSGTITMNGTLTMSGGTFTSTSGTMYLANSGYTYSGGTFSNNSGSVYIQKTCTLSGSLTFNNLNFASGDVYSAIATISGTLTVNGTLTAGGLNTASLTAGYIQANGNVDISSYGIVGTTSLTIGGSSNQTLTGGSTSNLNGITINKSGGTLTLSSTIYMNGNWTYIAGTISPASSLVYFNSAATISGSHTLNSVTFYGTSASTFTISSGTTLSLNGNLNLAGSNAPAIGTGTINVAGDVYAQSASTSGGGSGSIVLNGSSNQTIYGNTSGNNELCNLAVNKSGGDVTVDSSIKVYSGDLAFLDGSANYKLQATHGGTIYVTANRNVTMSSNCRLNRGTATIILNGVNNNQTISGSGKGILPNITIDKTIFGGGHPLSKLTISGTISVGGDWNYINATSITSTNSKVIFDPANKLHIIGTHTLNAIGFNNTTGSQDSVIIRSGTTLTANDTLFFSGTSGIKLDSAGTISAKGNIVITNTTTAGGGSSTINVNGTSNQTIVGTSTTTALPLCNLAISKTTGTLTINGTSVAAGGSVTCTSGTTTVNSSNTFYLYNTASVNAPAITFNHVSVASGTRSLAGNLSMNGDLTIASSTTLTAASTGNAISLQGNWANSGKFISGTGYVNFTGGNSQTISQPGGSTDSIAKLNINKDTNSLTLNSVLNISDSLQLTKGNIISDTTHLLVLWKRAKVKDYSDTSFVSGPVKKIGNTAFTFPLGKNSNAQSIGISAPSSATDAFQAEYFDTDPTLVYGTNSDTTFNYISTCQYFNLLRKNGTSNIQPTLGYDASSCVAQLFPSPTVVGFNGTKWKDLGITNLTFSYTGGTASTTTTITQYGAITFGIYNPLYASNQQGDSCYNSVIMPSGATSTVTGFSQTKRATWFTFTPTTSEVKVTLTNTSMGAYHIRAIALWEGSCLQSNSAGLDSSATDTTLSIVLHEAQIGTPYFIVTVMDLQSCNTCTYSPTTFNLQAQSLTPPTQTISNNIVYLNGVPSHMDRQIIIRVNKAHLNMSNVDNVSLLSGTVSQFIDTLTISKIALALYNGNTSLVNNLGLTKIFPNMTSADTISLGRDSSIVRVPDFFEYFILTVTEKDKIFYNSRLLRSILDGGEPNCVMLPTSVPNDALYSSNQANLHPTATYPNANINVEGAWDIETGKSFVKVGVYDSGIDGTHDDLNGSKVAGGYDFTSNTGISSGTNTDGYGHGTKCAGIIGGFRNDNTGIAGIAGGDGSISNPGCTLYDMRIFDASGNPVSVATEAAAIHNGATSTGAGGYGLHIMSCSWSGNLSSLGGSTTLHDAIQYAVQNSVIFCASRGNYPDNSGDALDQDMYPSCYSDEMVINVGASGIDGKWKTTTNGNPLNNLHYDQGYQSMIKHNVDVIAPGTTALVYTTEHTTNSSDSAFNGTSAACPHVSGVAALMLSRVNQSYPSPNNLAIEDVENILQMSANNLASGTGNYDDYNGWGLLDATAAMNKINPPTYKIQHFGVGQSGVSVSTTTTVLNGGNYELINLLSPYQGLPANTYRAYKVLVTQTLHYNLSDPNDQIIKAWPRYSSTTGWDITDAFNKNNWCGIVSVTPTQAVLQTYVYDFFALSDGTSITDPWYPVHYSAAKTAISIYTQNGLNSIDKINGSDMVMALYPNPANNSTTVNVSLSTPQKISLEIYDVEGRVVKTIAKERISEGIHQYPILLADMAGGMYYVRLVTETSTYGKKLIVTK